MSRPNILLVVWDACRRDAAREHAPTLSNLAASNVRFENAITPGGSSLPAHVSIATGTYPDEHGVVRQSHTIDSVPLVDTLNAAGYHTVGVSANGFASSKYGFDAPFDRFYNTQGLVVSPEGFDVHEYAKRVADRTGEQFSTDDVDYATLAKQVLTHEHPVASALNLGAAALAELVGAYPALRRIPHPRFSRFNEFCYDPAKNTNRITRVFEEHAERDRPFFVFANYMDPHHPYAPPERYQREYCGRSFSYRELRRLSHETHPWNYMERIAAGDPPSEEWLDTVRDLYHGEVRTADDHLRRLLDTLDRTGLREETLIVVTADHGENLGETDRLGERRMGHVCSGSDHHLRVPLVVAHPDLGNRTVEQYVSLKDLFGLLTEGADRLGESTGDPLAPLLTEAVVSAAVPATDNDALVEKYPELADVLGRHLVASYVDEWAAVVASTGEERVWRDGTERDPREAPPDLLETSQERLGGLVEAATEDRALSEGEIAHLEALGYM
ncbi:sulfatase [Haloplanus pelagicus]|uniref:sulfatase n=1 Tax=Haloplanus pelagicus TaxID=2949995 RepID=UPI00203C9052|nr:sulfatase [Haloplanus sp. HW8-1]